VTVTGSTSGPATFTMRRRPRRKPKGVLDQTVPGLGIGLGLGLPMGFGVVMGINWILAMVASWPKT